MYHYQGSYGTPYQIFPHPGYLLQTSPNSSLLSSLGKQINSPSVIQKESPHSSCTFRDPLNRTNMNEKNQKKVSINSPGNDEKIESTPYTTNQSQSLLHENQKLLNTPQLLNPHYSYRDMVPQYIVPNHFQSPQMVFPPTDMRDSTGSLIASSNTMVSTPLTTCGMSLAPAHVSSSNIFGPQCGLMQTPPLMIHPNFPYYFHSLGFQNGLPISFEHDVQRLNVPGSGFSHSNETNFNLEDSHKAQENSKEGTDFLATHATKCTPEFNFIVTPKFNWNALPSNLRDHPGFTPYRNVGGSDYDYLSVSKENMIYSQKGKCTPSGDTTLAQDSSENTEIIFNKGPLFRIFEEKHLKQKKMTTNNDDDDDGEELAPPLNRHLLKSSPMKPHSLIHTNDGLLISTEALETSNVSNTTIYPQNIPNNPISTNNSGSTKDDIPTEQIPDIATSNKASFNVLELDFDPYSLAFTKSADAKSTGLIPLNRSMLVPATTQQGINKQVKISNSKVNSASSISTKTTRKKKHPLSNVIAATKDLESKQQYSTGTSSASLVDSTPNLKRTRRTKKEMEDLKATVNSKQRAISFLSTNTSGASTGHQRKRTKFRNRFELIDLSVLNEGASSAVSSPERQRFPCPYSCLTLSTRDSWRKHLKLTHFQQSITDKALQGEDCGTKSPLHDSSICLECKERVSSCYEYYNRHIFVCKMTNSPEYLNIRDKQFQANKKGIEDYSFSSASFNESVSDNNTTGDSTDSDNFSNMSQVPKH